MLQQAKPVAKRERRARRFKGVHPSGGREICGTWHYDCGHVLIATINAGGEEWSVYKKPAPTDGWCNVRVVAKDSVYDKASYWLSWGIDRNRFGMGRDAQLLVEHRPVLHFMVAKLLRVYFEASDLL